jgi:amidohydrolase
MAGDDLAYFFQQARGCYFFVGAAYTDGRPQTTHHISTWDIDEECLRIGVEVMYGAARRALESIPQAP